MGARNLFISATLAQNNGETATRRSRSANLNTVARHALLIDHIPSSQWNRGRAACTPVWRTLAASASRKPLQKRSSTLVGMKGN